jgi:insulysin
MVFSSTRFSAASMGFQVLIQSERPAAYLETRVEAFMEYFRSFLEATTEEEFQTTKQGLVATNLESPKNMHGESARFWKAIDDGYCDFERRK